MTDSPGRPEQTGDTDQRTALDGLKTQDHGNRTAPDALLTGETAIGTAPDVQHTQHEESRTAPDAAEQTVSLNTTQAAQQLGVDSRTVRRYISEGIRSAGGAILRLQARQVRSNRGPERQIYQTDLEAFKEGRDRAATEGQAVGGLVTRADEGHGLTTAVHIIAAEL